MKYKILEHPAELRLRIFGKTIEELFSNAAEVMAQILSAEAAKSKIKNQKPRRRTSTLRDKSKIKIKVESDDINTLLVDFLSEILAKSQINKCVYLVSDIKIDASNFMLHASCIYFPVERFDEEIKAVTYQDLNIQKIDGIWQTILVFDI
jgi:SHS2 domain-containing protein